MFHPSRYLFENGLVAREVLGARVGITPPVGLEPITGSTDVAYPPCRPLGHHL